ncbi:MAG: SH3 domain-containing protein [Blautia sp.]
MVGDTDRDKINSNPIESYNNISIYYKPGLTDGSYNVYVYYEAKLPNIEQLVPSLGNLYLSTKEDGTLYVVNPSSDQQVSDFMEQAKNDSNVQELIAKTNSEYQAVLDSNSDLQAMIAKMKQPETELDIPDASSVDTDVSTSVTVTGDLNVRADSRADSDLVGVLIPGQTVTRLAVLDNGWSKIRFDDGAGTVVEGYVLSEYLQADGEASASSDAGTGSDQQ